MSDLVQRLRDSLSYDTPARYPEMVTEAADEIERLRNHNDRFRKLLAAFMDGLLVRQPDGTFMASKGTIADLGFLQEQISVTAGWPYSPIAGDLKLDC